MKKIILTLVLYISILIPVAAGEVYSNLKQEESFTCAPAVAANVINDICGVYDFCLQEELIKYLKTNNCGTTAANFCRGIEKFLREKKCIKTVVTYYGIKSVPTKYLKSRIIDFELLKTIKNDNTYLILNYGAYKNNCGNLVRCWGHYVYLTGFGEKSNELIILDPYVQGAYLTKWNYDKISPSGVFNKNDNEHYTQPESYFRILTPIPYLENDEYPLINGIIVVKIVQ